MAEEKRGEDRGIRADFLFEVSWEVCNKVGGINTVIETKIPQTAKRYGREYILVGPYFFDRVKGIFEESVVPDKFRKVCDDLRNAGIVIHYGRWLTDGNPTTILIDFQPLFSAKNSIKRQLWETAKVDSLNAGFDFEEPLVWSWAAGIVIERFAGMMPNRKSVAVFHEWLSGGGLIYLKSQKARVGTVFITHATVMGRSLATAGINIYCRDSEGICLMEKLDFESEAYRTGVAAKHQIEKSSANSADVFATVSEITGLEATHILKRSPDMLLPNGLDLETFPTIDENSIRHRLFRERIYRFLLYYFFPYYYVDIDNTLIYFIASRYEFHDKGIDIFIKALGKLNESLKRENSSTSIVVFIWVPSGIRGVRHEIVENRTRFKDIEDSLKDNAEHVMWRLLSDIVGDKPINKETIFTKDFISELKKKVLKFKSDSASPPLCTHDLIDPNDPITNALLENGLSNREEDKVKVISYPIYLTGADGLLDLTYHEAMQGSHLGVFPSFYEPWGYTPLEAGALGVASVTTDLAGFGRFLLHRKEYRGEGIFVLERMDKSDDDATGQLAKIMYYFAHVDKRSRIESKLDARNLTKLVDWVNLFENYIAAHNLAVERVFGP